MKQQKPHRLNKLSKKQLKKIYIEQWNQNIVAVGENNNLLEEVEKYYKALKVSEQCLQASNNARIEQNGVIAHKDRMLKALIES